MAKAKQKRVGLVIVNTGNGKGKTTAALGTAFRAVGSGLKVYMVQFIKGPWKAGEHRMAEKLGPDFTIKRMGEGFTWDTNDPARDTDVAHQAWDFCKDLIAKNEHDLLILDEINVALDLGYLDVGEVVKALKGKPEKMHIILTGRNARQEIIDAANLVTEMREVKHPFNEGIYAQKGIEF
jgi:cob(I)alamin adenosyltransferase